MLKKNLFFLVIFYLFVLQVALIGLLFSVPQFYTLAGVNLGALVVLLGLHSFFSKKKDEEIFTERLQTIFNVSISYYDVGKEEKYYHNILLGMILSLQKEYDITSNRESGSGRYDIVLEPKDRNKTAFVLEFKVGDNEEELEKLSIEAIEQIKEKEYASSMKFKGINDVLGVGIAFYKKKIRVKFEEI